MNCPVCKKGDTQVIDSRESEDGSLIRRRRECLKCGHRFSTVERLERKPLTVIKKDGRKVLFDRAKLSNGIYKAVEKSPVENETEKIEKMIDAVEQEIYDLGEDAVASKKIGDIVMKHLKRLDKVAYIRFASVYREFQDLDDFREEIKKLIDKKS
jgi:transcriptional repressor NrdR